MLGLVTLLTCDTESDRVGAVNVCANVTWDGWSTKVQSIRDYVASHPGFHVYIDSDVIVNEGAYRTWAPNKTVITVSAEKYCWVGHHCSAAEYAKFYSPARDEFAFVNAGAFMGPSDALTTFLTDVLDNCPPCCKGDDQCCFASLRRRHNIIIDSRRRTFASFGGWTPGASCNTMAGFAEYSCPRKVGRWELTSHCDVRPQRGTTPVFAHGNGAGKRIFLRMRRRRAKCKLY